MVDKGNAPESVQAIVVLGCRVVRGALSHAGKRRAAESAAAWHRGVAPRIVASGGRRWNGVAEADALADELVRRGVPRAVIFRELCSLTTFENAWYSARLLTGLGAGRVGIVTCDWHMDRALASFRRVGVSAVPIPVLSPRRSPFHRIVRGAKERARWWVEVGATRP